MKIVPTKLPGVFVIEPKSFRDERGFFFFFFHEETFKEHNLECEFKENFFSVSNKNVIRGMHFHLPPKAHSKLVYVTSGKVLDVVVDLRKNSHTYGQYISAELSANNHQMLYIPKGCGHGFISLEDNTCTIYLQTGVYSQEFDSGIHFDSFGFAWPCKKPTVSKRDNEMTLLKDFVSPF